MKVTDTTIKDGLPDNCFACGRQGVKWNGPTYREPKFDRFGMSVTPGMLMFLHEPCGAILYHKTAEQMEESKPKNKPYWW